ncbi:endo-1,4-beta-xylanase [Aquirufa rosea]|uniref:Beta-xylanase n=1 Tax=Aquirufa rosea TaxID=2509241 RepID=A0A4Q1BX29_9BACT|nr:endo-1,4-beta-xylanase [Aquirufa rosea]RXK46546.1 endo-1,4-beta-xylanase [Aquirufa rosea]
MKTFLTFAFLSFSPWAWAQQQINPTQNLKNLVSYPLGVAVNPRLLHENESYRKIVASEFTGLTAENHMKMALIHPEANRFDFSQADDIVSFAQAHQQRMHGHTLVWHNQTATWMKEFQGDQKAWEDMLKNHIQTVVKHFKGKVKGWDVVNEAFLDDGSLRPNIWSDHIPDYLAKSFIWAHEADPDALLFYNDYGQDGKPKKMQAILHVVEDFKRRQIPIHGLGLQMHISILSKNEQLKEVIQQATATGLQIHFSELDVAVNPQNISDYQYDEPSKKEQIQKYELLFQAFEKVPMAQRYGITFWNVGDQDSWLRGYFKRPKEYPLLFDENYLRKPAYQALFQTLDKVQ